MNMPLKTESLNGNDVFGKWPPCTFTGHRAAHSNFISFRSYAGIDAREMAKHYKGEVVYNMEGTKSGL